MSIGPSSIYFLRNQSPHHFLEENVHGRHVFMDAQTFQHRNDDLAALKLRDSHHGFVPPRGEKVW